MVVRSKKVCIILIAACLLGFYVYRVVDFHDSLPSFVTKKLADWNSKLESPDTDLYPQWQDQDDKTAFKLSFTRSLASESFQKALRCLDEARRNVARYLGGNDEISQEKAYQGQLEPTCNGEFTLIVLVTTKPGNFANRAAIRTSWGRMDSYMNKQIQSERPHLKWKSIFAVGIASSQVIGNLVSHESAKYKDILRMPYMDSYTNLPNKTMNSLEWIAYNCNTTFVLKTDDDCFVNIFHMLTWLNGLPNNYQYIGKVNTQMPVIRDPKHRNFVPKEEHEKDIYKPYCAGGGYIIRGSVLKNITNMGKRIKQIINEDAYMGMLTNALGIIPRNDERFLPFIFFGQPLSKRHMCEWKDQFLMHNVFGKRQLIMHYNSIAMTYFHSLCVKM